MADTDASVLSNAGKAPPFAPHEIKLASRYLQATRKEGGIAMIAWISVISIALAVAALITVMSIMTGFRSQLLGNLLDAIPHFVVDAREMSEEDQIALADRIRAEIDGVYAAGPTLSGYALGRSSTGDAPVQVLGVRPEDMARLPLGSQEADRLGDVGVYTGSLQEFGEGRFGGDTVLLAYGVARELGVYPGDTVTLIAPQGARTPFGSVPRTVTFHVGAVLTSGVEATDRFGVFMPLEQAQLFLNRRGQADFIEIRVETPLDDGLMKDTLDQLRLVAEGQTVSDWSRLNMGLFRALSLERTLMRLVMAVLIAIASMNIISGLVMLVKNKSRDIAILRTMGVTQAGVMRIFLIVGVTLGVVGTAIGVVLGSLLVIYIDPIQNLLGIPWDPEGRYLYRIPGILDLGEVAFAAGFCFFTSLLVTIPPAWRAARLDPVEALRYE